MSESEIAGRLSAYIGSSANGDRWIVSMCVYLPTLALFVEVYGVTASGPELRATYAAEDHAEHDRVWASLPVITNEPIDVRELNLPTPRAPEAAIRAKPPRFRRLRNRLRPWFRQR
jgi:hypothetical protein